MLTRILAWLMPNSIVYTLKIRGINGGEWIYSFPSVYVKDEKLSPEFSEVLNSSIRPDNSDEEFDAVLSWSGEDFSAPIILEKIDQDKDYVFYEHHESEIKIPEYFFITMRRPPQQMFVQVETEEQYAMAE